MSFAIHAKLSLLSLSKIWMGVTSTLTTEAFLAFTSQRTLFWGHIRLFKVMFVCLGPPWLDENWILGLQHSLVQPMLLSWPSSGSKRSSNLAGQDLLSHNLIMFWNSSCRRLNPCCSSKSSGIWYGCENFGCHIVWSTSLAQTKICGCLV